MALVSDKLNLKSYHILDRHVYSITFDDEGNAYLGGRSGVTMHDVRGGLRKHADIGHVRKVTYYEKRLIAASIIGGRHVISIIDIGSGGLDGGVDVLSLPTPGRDNRFGVGRMSVYNGILYVAGATHIDGVRHRVVHAIRV